MLREQSFHKNTYISFFSQINALQSAMLCNGGMQ